MNIQKTFQLVVERKEKIKLVVEPTNMYLRIYYKMYDQTSKQTIRAKDSCIV